MVIYLARYLAISKSTNFFVEKASTAMRAARAHRLTPKSVLRRRIVPIKMQEPRKASPPPPPQSAFRRRSPDESGLRGTLSGTKLLILALPIASPITYLTVYEFPSMRPSRICPYPSSFLRSPLRKDILHKAVVYEDNLARGTGGHTKTRGEVRGSTRKVRPQKGTGMARMGSIRAPGRRKGIYVYRPF